MSDLFFNGLFDCKFLSSLEFRQDVVQDSELVFRENKVQQLSHSDHNDQLKIEFGWINKKVEMDLELWYSIMFMAETKNVSMIRF